MRSEHCLLRLEIRKGRTDKKNISILRYRPFHSNLDEFRKAKDGAMVKDILLSEISDAVVNRRQDVIDKLNRSGLYVDSSTKTEELSQIVTDNLGNKKFIQGLSSIIAMKTPDDLSYFLSANGSKVTESDYIKDIYFAVDGNIKTDDKDLLSDKVSKLLESLGFKSSSKSSGSGWATFTVLSASALGIYFMVIRPIHKQVK